MHLTVATWERHEGVGLQFELCGTQSSLNFASMTSTVLASSIAIDAGQQAGTLQAMNHPVMTWADHGETKFGMVRLSDS